MPLRNVFTPRALKILRAALRVWEKLGAGSYVSGGEGRKGAPGNSEVSCLLLGTCSCLSIIQLLYLIRKVLLGVGVRGG